MSRLFVVIPIAAALVILPMSCRRDSSIDPTLFTVEVVDGAKHVHNHAPQRGDSSGLRLEFIGKIGKLEGEEEKDILYDPVDAARLPDGDIIVLERGGCVIKRYNKDHEYLTSFGQKGQGPGDFTSPYLLRLNRDRSRLVVADSRISVFSLGGEYQGGFKPERIARFGSIGAEYRTSGMAVLSNSEVVLPSNPSIWLDTGEHKLLSVHNEAGTVVRSFGTFEGHDNPDLTLNANIISITNDAFDNIYVAYAYQNRISKFIPGGQIIFSSDRPLAYDVKNVMKVELFKSGNLEREFPWPSVSSVTKGIHIDTHNRIWALTHLKQPNRFSSFDEGENLSDCYEFDVFDSQAGVLLFKVPFPNVRFDAWSMYDDRIYLIDSRDQSCVYEYKVIERK